MNKCVYFHINPLKNEIFYVGIGELKRAKAKKCRNIFWHNTVNKYGYIIDIAHSGLTLADAQKLEIHYIGKLGRKNLGNGALVNLTDGGGGVLGNKRPPHSEASKEKMRAAKLGKTHTLEHKLKVGLASKNRKRSPLTPEQKLKLSIAKKGKKLSLDHRLKIAKSLIGNKRAKK